MELDSRDLALRRERARINGIVLVASGTMQIVNAKGEWVRRPGRLVPASSSKIMPSDEALAVPNVRVEQLLSALRNYANCPVAKYPW